MKHVVNQKKGYKKSFYELVKGALCPTDKCDLKHFLFALISLATMAAAIGVVIYYILGPMEGYLHSDYTDTIYWSNASYESGKILDPDFRYAGILPFSANIWFIPYIAIFGFGMTAHKLGMITYLILQSAAVWFMLRSFKWSVSSTSLTISAFLLLLSGSDKLREMMWGHVIYYSLAILILCVGVGLVYRLSEKKINKDMFSKSGGGWKYILLLVLLAIIFCGNATNGFQLIALATLPCIVCALGDIFFSNKKKLHHPDNFGAYIAVAIIVVSTFVGTRILKAIQGNITVQYTEYYSKIMPPSKWMENALLLPKHWFTLLGCNIKENTKMFDPEGIGTVLFAFIGVMLIVLPLVGIICYRKIEDKGTRTILWMHLTVSAGIIFGYVCGTLGNAIWRMLPMLATSILATAATVKYLAEVNVENSLAPRRVAAILAVLILVGSCFNFKVIRKMDYNYGRDNVYHKLCDELMARDLEYGYATFWYSQSITLLSDYQIKARMILAEEKNGVTTDYYQNKFSWYDDVEGVDRYFVLLTDGENKTVEKSEAWRNFVKSTHYKKERIVGNYVLYIFEENLDFPDPEKYK